MIIETIQFILTTRNNAENVCEIFDEVAEFVIEI